VWARFFAHVQTGPGAHRASCTMGTVSLSPRLKRSGLETNHWNPSDGIEIEWIYSSVRPCASVACRWIVLPSLTLAGSDSKTFAATHKEFWVFVQTTQVPVCLRRAELGCVVTNAFCVCTNSVGEEVGLYNTA